MAEEEATSSVQSELPSGRVKRIMKLDKDVNKVNSEALFLVCRSAEMFIRFLAEKSAEVAIEKKRKTIKLDDLRVAVKKHRPTSDFLLDSLPVPTQSSDHIPTDRARTRTPADKPVPAGTRRIDDFFHKPENEIPVQIEDP